MCHFMLMFHSFISSSLSTETYSESRTWPWCVPSIYLFLSSTESGQASSLHRLFPFLELLHYFFFLECSPTTSYVQFSLIYVGYLSKSSSLGDGDAFSNYCHPRYELLHLCLSSYWFCLFFFSLPFVVDSHPRNTAISIHVASFVLGHTLLSSQDFVSCFLLYHLQPKLHLTSERFYQTDSTDK